MASQQELDAAANVPAPGSTGLTPPGTATEEATTGATDAPGTAPVVTPERMERLEDTIRNLSIAIQALTKREAERDASTASGSGGPAPSVFKPELVY